MHKKVYAKGIIVSLYSELMLSEADLQHLRTAIAVSRNARKHGNQPFGAVLVDDKNKLLLQAENTQVTDRDCTGHAEANLMREASRKYARDLLANCTLYASTEPCALCAAAIYWGGVGRVVYALSAQIAYDLAGEGMDRLDISCREVLAHGQRRVGVSGPALEDDAKAPLHGFWG